MVFSVCFQLFMQKSVWNFRFSVEIENLFPWELSIFVEENELKMKRIFVGVIKEGKINFLESGCEVDYKEKGRIEGKLTFRVGCA